MKRLIDLLQKKKNFYFLKFLEDNSKSHCEDCLLSQCQEGKSNFMGLSTLQETSRLNSSTTQVFWFSYYSTFSLCINFIFLSYYFPILFPLWFCSSNFTSKDIFLETGHREFCNSDITEWILFHIVLVTILRLLTGYPFRF
jgi:hypothetical protein